MTERERGRAWVLTGSLENFRVSVERGFDVIGLKERRRKQATELEPGDEVIFYVTGVQAFGAIARIRSPMFEDRTAIWPGKPGKPDDYPWRVEAEPIVVLEEPDLIAAEGLADRLEHVRKWPPEHWQLAFQGQLRPVGRKDAALLRHEIEAAAKVKT
ncbi:MAG: EVE domain-containing protein [Solirubrobacterales bacterium]